MIIPVPKTVTNLIKYIVCQNGLCSFEWAHLGYGRGKWLNVVWLWLVVDLNLVAIMFWIEERLGFAVRACLENYSYSVIATRTTFDKGSFIIPRKQRCS